MTAATPRRDGVILPPALRAPAAVVSAVSVLVFAVFAARYAEGTTARWLDERLLSLIAYAGDDPALSDVVIRFGDALSVVVLAVLLCGTSLALGHRRLAVLAIVGPGLTGVATTALKPLVGRTLAGEFAFPSGHTGGATALGVVIALLLVATLQTRSGPSAALLAVGATVSGGGMAVAIVADRDHYPTDTIGGFCVAVAVVFTSALLIEQWAERDRRSPRPRERR